MLALKVFALIVLQTPAVLYATLMKISKDNVTNVFKEPDFMLTALAWLANQAKV
jgi:hypothetical protein